MQMHLHIIRVEQGLGKKSLFKNGISQTEQDDAKPAAVSSTDNLAYQEYRAERTVCCL